MRKSRQDNPDDGTDENFQNDDDDTANFFLAA